MADENAKVSARYRELPREEPPRHIDEAILAAARRATASRPAPLVAPTGRRRWYFPVAAAAIIVLAVALTVHVERQQPDLEVAEQRAAPVQAPVPEPAPKRDSSAPADLQKSQTSSSPPAAPAPQSTEPLAGLRESQRSDTAPSVAQARPEARAMRSERAAEKVVNLAPTSPEQWLQGILDLKRQGRHEEAEKQLGEFRKRYPDYRIPEAIAEKFEKR